MLNVLPTFENFVLRHHKIHKVLKTFNCTEKLLQLISLPQM